MYAHIVVPLDGSELAESAIPATVRLANAFDAKLTLLRVASTPQMRVSRMITGLPDAADLYMTLRQQALSDARAYLDTEKTRHEAECPNVTTHVAEGISIPDTLLDAIGSIGADLIVMSTHGRSGVSRWLLGSGAEQFMRASTVPVLLMRATETPVGELLEEHLA